MTSNSHKHTIWAETVKEKYDYTCQKCGIKGDDHSIHAHHILSFTAFEESRFDINNGICLCVSCHKDFHSMHGVMRNTEDDFNEWLTEDDE